MRFYILIFCLGIVLGARAQEFAPESVANTVVIIIASSGGTNFPPYSMLLSSNGISYLVGSTGGPLRASNTYTWTKTSGTTGTLGFGAGPVQTKTLVTFFESTRGGYEGSLGTGTMLFSPYKLGADVPLSNLSSLVTLGRSQPTTVGFVVGGRASRQVLVRAIGPALAQFGLASFAVSPVLRVYNKAGQVAINSGWGGGAQLAKAFAAVGAFALPVSSSDSALLLTLDGGSYTAQVQADSGGDVLVEIYYLD